MIQLSRPTILAAGLGGALWTAKVAGLVATDGSFGALEGIAFLGGLAALVGACVLLALDLGRRLRGFARAAATVLATVGLVVASVAIENVGVGLIGGAYTGGNVAIEDEGGILLCGLAWLTVAAVGARHRDGARTRTAAPAVP